MRNLYLIDDDDVIRDALDALFRSRGLAARAFGDARAFLDAWREGGLARAPACLLIDVRMPGMSGFELFAQLRDAGLGAHHAVVFLTGHGDIPMAVDALRAGAYDFLEKPFSDNRLVDRVVAGLDHAYAHAAPPEATPDERFANLTPRERAIAERIVAGCTNREIADALRISVRTVEVHRARVFEKLDVKNAIGLAQLRTRAARLA
ncbi:response regulator transcription factor [Burkholderia multivorans]|uniref:response regulator transcription factor n=1 Tax=Burkholderia multivorans TaxID=87883 RepID=UPI000D020131|nr:response regulator [Burkholderia multivorans]MBU9338248.1 response regulator [Burkholderia multivorans]MCA8139034.1 response regulator [Burkholderia multivorans]MCO1363536.1 response regulator [Burkholderia multivorans]MCO1379424.1 response regulator [Burkholderia multivorans]PRH49446.1 DNA-binding response regulator [Burkholderia multivorans]